MADAAGPSFSQDPGPAGSCLLSPFTRLVLISLYGICSATLFQKELSTGREQKRNSLCSLFDQASRKQWKLKGPKPPEQNRRLYLWWVNVSSLLPIEQGVGNCLLIYTGRHCQLCSTHFCPAFCCGWPCWWVQLPPLPSWTPSRKRIFWPARSSSQQSRRTLPYVFCFTPEVTTYQVKTSKEHHEHTL